MKTQRLIAFCMAAVLLAAGLVYLYGRAGTAEQKSVLRGTVCKEELARTGMKVQTGDVLVRVRSVAGGSIAAARADRDGIVRQVLVQPGDNILPEQAVVILED